jgi:hypothetical protein
MRLFEQGLELCASGALTIRLADPERYFDFGERVAADPQAAVPFMARAEERFIQTRQRHRCHRGYGSSHGRTPRRRARALGR